MKLPADIEWLCPCGHAARLHWYNDRGNRFEECSQVCKCRRYHGTIRLTDDDRSRIERLRMQSLDEPLQGINRQAVIPS